MSEHIKLENAALFGNFVTALENACKAWHVCRAATHDFSDLAPTSHAEAYEYAMSLNGIRLLMRDHYDSEIFPRVSVAPIDPDYDKLLQPIPADHEE